MMPRSPSGGGGAPPWATEDDNHGPPKNRPPANRPKTSAPPSSQEAMLALIRERKDSKSGGSGGDSPNPRRQSPSNMRPGQAAPPQRNAKGPSPSHQRPPPSRHSEGAAAAGDPPRRARVPEKPAENASPKRASEVKARLREEERKMSQLKVQQRRTQNKREVFVGDRVGLNGRDDRHGTVMFVGPTEFAKKGEVIVGLSLDNKRSNSANDGKVEETRYFRCKPGHALFVDIEDVQVLDTASEAGIDSGPLFLETELLKLVGCGAAKELLRDVRDALEVNERRAEAGGIAERSPHMVVSGMSSTGISTWGRIAARLAHTYDCTRKGKMVAFSAQNGAGLVSSSRSSSMEALTRAVKDAAGGVLFVDDAHAAVDCCGGDNPGRDVMEGLARELERQRSSAAGDAVVVVLAGETAGISSLLRTPLGAALGISAPQGGDNSRHLQLPGFSAPESLLLLDTMAEAKGFSLERGAIQSPELGDMAEEMCRRAGKGQATSRQVAVVLDAAISAQTKRVHAMGTISKNSLTTLLVDDFLVSSKALGQPGSGDSGGPSPLAQLEKVIGLAGVKKFVKSLQAQLILDEQRRQSGLPSLSSGALHMIFAGNPGTGKTTVARIVAALLAEMGILSSGHLVEADRASLVAGYVGQTAIKVTNVVKEALGGILFVDEAYTLVQGDKDSFGREALDTLMKLMEDHRDELVVVFAGYSEEMDGLLSANPGLRSRFPTSILFANYDAGELMAICNGMLSSEHLTMSGGAAEQVMVALEEVAKKAATGDRRAANGRAVRNLIEEAKRNQALRLSELASGGAQVSRHQLTELTEDDVQFATDPAWVTGS